MVLRWFLVYFRCFDQILLVPAQNITIEWSFSFNLICYSKMISKLLENDLFMVLRWIIKYLNHFNQSLPVFNLTIIIERSVSCLFVCLLVCILFFCFACFGGTAEKIEMKMEQFENKIHGKIMYVNKNINKETINNIFL